MINYKIALPLMELSQLLKNNYRVKEVTTKEVHQTLLQSRRSGGTEIITRGIKDGVITRTWEQTITKQTVFPK
jgi:hypothetical protein